MLKFLDFFKYFFKYLFFSFQIKKKKLKIFFFNLLRFLDCLVFWQFLQIFSFFFRFF